jgi:hypothetical protein
MAGAFHKCADRLVAEDIVEIKHGNCCYPRADDKAVAMYDKEESSSLADFHVKMLAPDVAHITYLFPSLSSAFFRGLHTTSLSTWGLSKSYSHADQVPSSKVTDKVVSLQKTEESSPLRSPGWIP